ncbi:MAG: PLP-dependent aminotransferase family protein [Chloroflexi bacterium]|nr:PLP-dependent aminotransferase family protein [Chloroflexota bacterium]MYD37871.1 PLP-dependent aminotransferase family protein [Chloroflexota bacterium]MYH65725.1 PLP-dependent aminotransferase family protein [Chloroflexota bacterium]
MSMGRGEAMTRPQSAQQGIIPGSIPLFAGHPAPDLLPAHGIGAVLAGWDERPPLRAFNYGDEQGDPLLLDFLLARLNGIETLGIKRDNLMIVPGSTGGVAMITRLLTQAGDTVLVDAPSYRDALHIFRDQGLRLRAIPIDAEGPKLDALEAELERLAAEPARPRFYYVVPNFQNPSGITISEDRRRAVIERSKAHGFIIVEDDVYSDLRFAGKAPPSFYALAGGENVLRLGSFSKTLAPGLRLGWLVGSARQIADFGASGILRMGGGANPFCAAVVAEYCRSGAWSAHVDWLRGQYQARRDLALAALENTMPDGVSWTHPQGGYFIWLRLPDMVDVDTLERRAQAEQVYFANGRGFFAEPAMGAQHLRLSYSYLSHDKLRQGIGSLGRLIAGLSG